MSLVWCPWGAQAIECSVWVGQGKRRCNALNVSPEIPVLKPSALMWCHSELGLWQMTWSWWWSPWEMDWSPCQDPQSSQLSCVRAQQGDATYEPGSSPHKTLSLPALWPWTSCPKNSESMSAIHTSVVPSQSSQTHWDRKLLARCPHPQDPVGLAEQHLGYWDRGGDHHSQGVGTCDPTHLLPKPHHELSLRGRAQGLARPGSAVPVKPWRGWSWCTGSWHCSRQGTRQPSQELVMEGGLACCYSWGRKESDTTEWLNWTDESLKDKEIYVICYQKPYSKLCLEEKTKFQLGTSLYSL